MRGRASGFGARISSMVLLIVAFCKVHLTDLRLNVCLLFFCDAIFRVKSFIRPSAVPCLHRHPDVSGVRRVLSNLSHGDEESEKSRRVIRLETLGRFE